MESRLRFDGSQFTEVVTASTVATVSSAQALTGHATVVVNNPAAALKGPIGISVYAATSPPPAAGPTDSDYFLGVKLSHKAFAAGATETFTVTLKAKKGSIPVGTYTLYAVAADETAASIASTGPALTVTPPVISLSETETFKKLGATVASGGTFKVTDVVRITNHGTDTSDGDVTVGVYGSPEGSLSDATAIGAPTVKSLKIGPRHSATVSVKLSTFPTVTADNYDLITQVIDHNGVATTVDTATIAVPGETPAAD